MRIIFGWSEFKIEKYTSVAIGIEESILPKTQIRLVQEYFHLFFIPFFGTRKTWYYNSNDNWFILKPEHEAQITSKYKNRFTPWYSYSGILLLLFVGVGYYFYNIAHIINKSNNNELELQVANTKFTKQLNHLDEETYISLESRNDGSIVSTLYLKIESIKGQKILCSIIDPIKSFDITPLYVDSLYNNRKSILDTISIIKQNLVKAISLKNDEEYTTSTSGVLIYGKYHSIIDIKEHGKPCLIKGNHSSENTNGDFMISFVNQLDEGKVVGIENSKSTKLNWKTILPLTIPAGCMTNDKNDMSSIFEINGTGYKSDAPFEFVLKCIYKKNKKINYLVKGNVSEYEIEEMY
jgi:hypothetical protein